MTLKPEIKLTKRNYYSHHSDLVYMSATWFKRFEACEAAAWDLLQHPVEETSTALLVGNFVHSNYESKQAHEAFIKDHDSEINTRNGTLRAPFEQAKAMIDRLNKFDEFMYFYNSTDCKKEAIVTGQLFGVNWKAKLDSLNVEKGYFCDLKTTMDMHRTFYNPETHKYDRLWFDEYNYGLQMAAYKKLLQLKYHKPFKCYVFAVDKTKSPAVEAIEFDMKRFEKGLSEIELYQPRLMAVLSEKETPIRCEHCDFCKSTYEPFGFKSVDDLVNEKYQ